MELSVGQQIFDQVGKADKILIALPAFLAPDGLASGLALAGMLQKMGKDVELASAGKVAETLEFLPKADTVKGSFQNGQSLVISLNTGEKKLEEISYQTHDDKVDIYLKANKGTYLEKDFSFNTEKSAADIIFILDGKSLEDLGGLFESHADLFFETPKINIDNKAGNEYFGAINLVDVTATSIAEILTGLIFQFQKDLVDEDIATCLLAGIISRTNSFQQAQTTPKSLLQAADLVSLGARQQEIVKHFYKTKPLPLLKLWGRALARLKADEEKSAIYSLLNQTDFEKSEADGKDLPGAVRELVNNVANYQIVGIIGQVNGSIRLLAAVHAQRDIENLKDKFEGEAKITNSVPAPFKMLDVDLGSISLQDAEAKFLEAIRQ
ncbi:MAG: hypothetical protein M1383_04700 [Patescibacteria group bacterium]|nr:hypothetical protein [Patescibacteria group bacterium]